MKTRHLIAALVLTLTSAIAGPGHHPVETGPNGGRVISTLTPPVEFLVLPDRRVRLTFLNAAKAALPPGNRVATVTTGSRTTPVRLAFQADGESLVSENPLPGGDDFPVVLQIQSGDDTKPALAKFQLNLSICGECKNPEYICSCEHTH